MCGVRPTSAAAIDRVAPEGGGNEEEWGVRGSRDPSEVDGIGGGERRREGRRVGRGGDRRGRRRGEESIGGGRGDERSQLGQQGHGVQQQKGQQGVGEELGQYFLAVRVWPCARLPRGCAALSSAAAEACGRPQPGGCAVALYRTPHALVNVPVCHTLVLKVSGGGLHVCVLRMQCCALYRTPLALVNVPMCCWLVLEVSGGGLQVCRVGQNRIYTPYMTI